MKVERSVYGKLIVVATAAALLGGCALRGEVASGHGSLKDGPVASAGSRPTRVAGVAYARPVMKKAVVRRAVVKPAAVAEKAEPAPKAAAVSAPAPETQVVGKGSAATASVPQPEPRAAAAPTENPADRASRTRSDSDARTVSLQLLAEGQRLFAIGKVMEARRRYFAAMDGPVPDVLLALARSFDTHYLSRLQNPDGAPDMTRAMALYERAAERGSPEANADITRIRAATQQSAPEPVQLIQPVQPAEPAQPPRQ